MTPRMHHSTRARILVPPGIGDGYWVLIKLRGFLQRYGIVRCRVHVHDVGPRRAQGMWERVPFVEWGGYTAIAKSQASKNCFNRAYRMAGYAVQRGVMGFDYFISLNGTLDHGRSLDMGLPGPTNWYEPLSRMEVTEHSAALYRRQYGEYVAVGVWDHGFYRHWLAQFPEPRLVDTLRLIADSGRTVVLMGAEWDKGGLAPRIAAQDPRFVSLVGDTDFDQLTGLLAGAVGVFGFPAGNTMLGPRFKTPTVLLWNKHFPQTFWRSACPPDAMYYQPMDTYGATPHRVADALLTMQEVLR